MAASDVGWIVGHSYIVYAPLFHGCTTVLYEGKPVKTPDAGTFWRIIQEHKVRVLFTAPTAIRAIKKEDPTGSKHQRFDTSCLRNVFLAGERCDVATYKWLKNLLDIARPKILIRSKRLITELKFYIRKAAGFQARIGATDDLVAAILVMLRVTRVAADYDIEAFDRLYGINSEEDLDLMGEDEEESLPTPMLAPDEDSMENYRPVDSFDPY